MKNFLEGVLAWKTAAAFMFSGSVVVCVIIMLFTGADSVPIPVLASLLLVSTGGTFLQLLAFTDRMIKRLRYTARMVVFAIPFLLLLAANAYLFRWFPIHDTLHWLTFVGIFFVTFMGGTAAFELYFHVMGKKYDGLLGQYRKQKESEK